MLRRSTPRRDTDLFRLRAMGVTIGIAARPDHRTAVRLRLEDGEEAVRPRAAQDASGVRRCGARIDGTAFEPTIAFSRRSATLETDFRVFTCGAAFGAEGSVTRRDGVRPEIESGRIPRVASQSAEPVRRRGLQCAPGRRARTSWRGRG